MNLCGQKSKMQNMAFAIKVCCIYLWIRNSLNFSLASLLLSLAHHKFSFTLTPSPAATQFNVHITFYKVKAIETDSLEVFFIMKAIYGLPVLFWSCQVYFCKSKQRIRYEETVEPVIRKSPVNITSMYFKFGNTLIMFYKQHCSRETGWGFSKFWCCCLY